RHLGHTRASGSSAPAPRQEATYAFSPSFGDPATAIAAATSGMVSNSLRKTGIFLGAETPMLTWPPETARTQISTSLPIWIDSPMLRVRISMRCDLLDHGRGHLFHDELRTVGGDHARDFLDMELAAQRVRQHVDAGPDALHELAVALEVTNCRQVTRNHGHAAAFIATKDLANHRVLSRSLRVKHHNDL